MHSRFLRHSPTAEQRLRHLYLGQDVADTKRLRAGHLVREVPGDAAAGGAPRGTGARTIA